MATRQNGTLAFGFAVAALVWILGGWGASVWLAGRTDPAAPFQATLALALLAVGTLAVLWATIANRRRDRWERLRALAPTAAKTEGDEAGVVERLVIERNQAAQELRRIQEETAVLERALEERLSGTGRAEWPTVQRLEVLSRRIEALLADRDDDATSAADLLGIWIERLERLRLRLEVWRSTAGLDRPGGPDLRGGGERTGGEEPKEPSVSSTALLSLHVRQLEEDLARLEDAARTLRRRLGGASADSLSDDDIVP